MGMERWTRKERWEGEDVTDTSKDQEECFYFYFIYMYI